jgi:hypothetical protein
MGQHKGARGWRRRKPSDNDIKAAAYIPHWCGPRHHQHTTNASPSAAAPTCRCWPPGCLGCRVCGGGSGSSRCAEPCESGVRASQAQEQRREAGTSRAPRVCQAGKRDMKAAGTRAQLTAGGAGRGLRRAQAGLGGLGGGRGRGAAAGACGDGAPDLVLGLLLRDLCARVRRGGAVGVVGGTAGARG